MTERPSEFIDHPMPGEELESWFSAIALGQTAYTWTKTSDVAEAAKRWMGGRVTQKILPVFDEVAESFVECWELLDWVFDYLTSECDWGELNEGRERDWVHAVVALSNRIHPPPEAPVVRLVRPDPVIPGAHGHGAKPWNDDA